MIQRLFVYETLAPGKPNAHILKAIDGTWQKAQVKGHLKQQGWGVNLGYPGIVLDEGGEVVEGLLFSSNQLDSYWHKLDEFEGQEYHRVCTLVEIEAQKLVDAYVYVIKQR